MSREVVAGDRWDGGGCDIHGRIYASAPADEPRAFRIAPLEAVQRGLISREQFRAAGDGYDGDGEVAS